MTNKQGCKTENENSEVAHRWSLAHIRFELFAALIIGVLAAIVMPRLFGEESIARQYAKFYAPAAGYFYGSGNRDELTVLLIDDSALQASAQPWPPHYAYYARLMRAVGLYHPKAIFLDIMLSEQRDDPAVSALGDVICQLSAKGVAVYLATPRNVNNELKLRPELDALSPKCFTKVLVEYAPDEVDHLAWTYPLAARDSHGARLRTAALAIYEDTFGKPLADSEATLAVTWGLSPATNVMHPRILNADGSEGALYCRKEADLRELSFSALHNFWIQNGKNPPCVFHETLYPSDLSTSTDDDEQLLRSRITGKVLFIGTGISATNDQVVSPIHQRVPGVYLHAMALDNLLTYGDAYRKVTQLGWPFGKTGSLRVWILLLLAMIPVAAANLLKHHLKDKPGPAEKLRAQLYEKKYLDCEWLPHKAIAKLASGAVKVMLKSLLALLVVVLTLTMIYVGQSLLNIDLITILDFAIFAVAAEWFEWNLGIREWWNAEPKSNGSNTTSQQGSAAVEPGVDDAKQQS